jgi:hypothetical protein
MVFKNKDLARVMAASIIVNNLQGYLASELDSLLAGCNVMTPSHLEVLTDRVEREVDEYMAKLHQCSK